MRTNFTSACLVVSMWLVFCSQMAMAQELAVPAGSMVLSNGFFLTTEWADANRLEVSDSLEVFAKQDDRYLYLGIRTPRSSHTGIDLFIASTQNSRHHLHVSSALSEAIYSNSNWSDSKWEENTWWVANKIGLYQDDSGRRTSEPEGFEFQISLDKLKSNDVALALHLKRPDLKYPADLEDSSISNWLRLILNN